MYPLEADRLVGLRAGRWAGVGPNVFFLGLTSMLTDISSEMATSVLPIYLVFAIGLTPLQFGLVDGISQAAAAAARLASGLLADRWQRNREVAAFGYGVSALCKPLLLAAGSAWGLVAGTIALDRIGKGIRTAPRDALISLSCTPQRLGLAFGIHRAFDTAGALIGPLLAFALLAMLPLAFDLIFVTSFFVAVIGLATLLCFVRNAAPAAPALSAPRVAPADAVALLRSPAFRRLVVAGSLLGLVTVADAFFFLTLQRKTAVQASAFPLFYVATALSYLLLAVPAGRLGDRFGRQRVFLLGQGLLLLACLQLIVAGDGLVSALSSLVLLGAYYACTDGVLMAAAAGLLPSRLRATGLAIVATAAGVSRLLASLIFGALWNWHDLPFALSVFAGGLAVAIALTARTWWQPQEGR